MQLMRSALLVIALATFGLPTAPASALIPVECPACASAQAQIVEYALQAKQYAVEMQQYITLADTYAKAVISTAELPAQAVSQVQGVYYRGAGLMRRTNALLASDAPIMQRLAMARSVGASAGRYPTGAMRNAEFWGDRVQDQWKDNRELLGIEQQRQEINGALLELSASNGNIATGQFQMLQAQHGTLLAMGSQLQAIQGNLQQQFAYQMEKDADEQLKQKAYNDFMGGMQELTADKQW